MAIVVSVIIPTYQDWHNLQCCLTALKSQYYPQECIEVFVVNNAPDDPPPAGLPYLDEAVVLTEPKPGSYAARNAAIRQARGEILAFLDADCVPEPTWLEAGIRCLTNDTASLVAGHVALTFQGARLMPAECFEKAFAFRQFENVKKGMSVTANLFVIKQVFTQIGFFDENLMSGGDFEWTRRATTCGSRLVYCPDAVIRHPARTTIKALSSKARRVSAGSRALYREKRVLNGIRRVAGTFLSDINYLRKRPDMTHRERSWALLVLVYLKIVKVRHRLAFCFSGKRMAQERVR